MVGTGSRGPTPCRSRYGRRHAGAVLAKEGWISVLVYDNDTRALTDKLNDIQHQSEGVITTALHVHLDAHSCLEVIPPWGEGQAPGLTGGNPVGYGGRTMDNSPRTSLGTPTALLLNVGHALDHLFLLIFATAVAAIAAEWGWCWKDLMPYTVGAFVMFGLGSLPAGRLGDLWGRRAMMIVFFLGMGAAAMLVALTAACGRWRPRSP